MIVIEIKRRYIDINAVQREYLPLSKKKLRALVKQYLSVIRIGNRIYVDRNELEQILTQKNSFC